MPLKLLTFNSAASEWINPSDGVLIKICSFHLFFRGASGLLYLSLPKSKIEPFVVALFTRAFILRGSATF